MSVSIPEQPANQGPFNAQHGYADINVKPQKYSDKPTPISPHSHQNKASGFVSEHTDKEHVKKYEELGGKRLFNMLIGFLCH